MLFEDLDRVLLGAGDFLFAPRAGPPTSAVFDEQVGRADLVVVVRGTCVRVGRAAVGQVLGSRELSEVGVCKGGGHFPARLLGFRVVKVGALAGVAEADLCVRACPCYSVRCGTIGARARMTSERGRETDPRLRPASGGRESQQSGRSRVLAPSLPRPTLCGLARVGRVVGGEEEATSTLLAHPPRSASPGGRAERQALGWDGERAARPACAPQGHPARPRD